MAVTLPPRWGLQRGQVSVKQLKSVPTASSPQLLPSTCLSEMPTRGGDEDQMDWGVLAQELQRRRTRWHRFHACLVSCFQVKLGSGAIHSGPTFPWLSASLPALGDSRSHRGRHDWEKLRHVSLHDPACL